MDGVNPNDSELMMILQNGLTGNQVRSFRTHLGESQAVFAKRLGVSQPVIFRMERKGVEIIDGPETRLIRRIATDVGFSFDEAAN